MAPAPNRGRRSPGGQGKPGRALVLFLLIAAVLTGGMFASGHITPRLGIDLAGGTSITLSVDEKRSKADAINETNLNTAADIIQRRVDGLGVSEAQVQTQGDRNIVVNIPKGADEKQAREQVGTTAQLYFRPVIAQAAGTAKPDPEASSPDKADEAEKEGEDGADESGDKSTDESGDASKDEDEKAGRGDEADTSPSPEETTKGRPVTDGLRADDKPSPSAEPSQGAKEPNEKDDTAALQKKLDELDCTSAKGRAEANVGAGPKDSIVACGTETGDQAVKYALGPAAVHGVDVNDAEAVMDTTSGRGWIVQMKFNDRGTKRFADTTEKLSTQQPPQNQFAIVLDGEVVSAPSVSQRLGGGSAEIYGHFSQDEAAELANVLKYGALPLAFEEGTVTSISPTLGGEQLRAGLIAGAIGLLLVTVYLLFYYRVLGLVAIASLVGAVALTYPVMTLLGPAIGFALSLPAVCGAIVAIGITADSFIVYFERIRDEVREGRGVRTAVERAWPRARRTILVSDVVSFIAAVVLFIVSIGSVQGFAFVLGLTTFLDVLVIFLLTRPLMSLLIRRKFFYGGHRWSGLSPERLGARPVQRYRRRSATASGAPKEV